MDSDGVCDLDRIGTKVRKEFPDDIGWFDGEVTDVTGPGLFRVTYTDGDTEDLDRDELNEFELQYDQYYLL